MEGKAKKFNRKKKTGQTMNSSLQNEQQMTPKVYPKGGNSTMKGMSKQALIVTTFKKSNEYHPCQLGYIYIYTYYIQIYIT